MRKKTKRIHRPGIKSAPMLDGEWRDVIGFSGLYSVSADGRVYSHRSNKVLKPGLQTNGYQFVCLYGEDWKNNKAYRLHRIVAGAFIENPESLAEVNHKNGIKSDNRAANLEWSSRRDNVIHSVKVLGRNEYKRDGELNPNAKRVASFSDREMSKKVREFGSIVEASAASEVFRTAISQAIRTGCRSAGFFWRYA